MKRRISILLISVLLCALCISCGKTENNTDIENETPNNIEENQQSDVQDEKDNVEDIVKPDDKEALSDDIETDNQVEDSDVNIKAPAGFELVGVINESKYFMFQEVKDDSVYFGIIDIDGNVRVPAEYTTLGWCPWHEVIYAEPFAEGTPAIVLDEKYKIDLHYGHGGFFDDYQYMLDKNSGKMFRYLFDFDAVNISEVGQVEFLIPYVIYEESTPVAEGDYYWGEDSWYDKLNDIAYAGLDQEYEFITEKGSVVNLGKCSYVSDFVNGYILVCRDGDYGYINTKGEESSDFSYELGQFAYEDKAWVKKDGEWTVINLA